MADTRLVVFKFLFLFLYVLLFLLIVFSFLRTLSIIGKIFLIEAYPFKNICQIENFRNCLSTKRVFTEQVVCVSLCEVPKL